MKHLTIPGRLTAGFAAVLALTILLALLCISRMAGIQRNLETIVGTRLEAVAIIGHMRYDVVSVSEKLRDVIFARDISVRQEAAASLKRHIADYFTALDKLSASSLTERERVLMREMLAAQDAAVRACDGAMKAALEGRTDDAATLFEAAGVRSLENAWIEALGSMAGLQRTLAAEAADGARADYEQSTAIAIALAATATALGVAIAWLTSRSIVRPLADAVHVARQVAQGKLDVDIDRCSNDEIGQLMLSLQQMTRSLTQIVGEARNIADAILRASGDIMEGNDHLSQRTAEQSGSVEQTACSMEQFTRAICSNTASAEQANLLAESTRVVATQGGEAVAVVRQTMETISESATRIAGIINLIDSIAFQTNILALNAAVEAARAGEQGRGFAVVAAEVRQLAQRSASAARDIKQLVNGSVSRIDTGSALAQSAEATMNEVVGGVNRVAGILAEITQASKEQSAGIGQVNAAIGCIDQAARRNRSLAAQANRTTQDLKALAVRLADVVGVFELPEVANGGRIARLGVRTSQAGNINS